MKTTEILYGRDSGIALSMTDVLGLFHLSRGDLAEYLHHSQKALSGLEKLQENNSQHRATLVALNHLGVIQAQYYKWKESKQLCKTALAGLLRLDADDDEVWYAKQNVAIADLQIGGDEAFEEAEALMTDVLRHWRLSLGNKHPTTLLASFNLSRVLLRRGKTDEAKNSLLPALKAAESQLGATDLGFLAARVILTCIKLRQREYVRAEEILLDVDEAYTQTDISRDHVDRISALWYLTECYKEQGHFDRALEVCEKASNSIKASMAFNLRVRHPLAQHLSEKRQEIEITRQAARLAAARALDAANTNGKLLST